MRRVSRWFLFIFLFLIAFFIGLYIHFVRLVDRQLNQDLVSVPARIFTEPLNLQPGTFLNRSDITAYLQNLNYLPADNSVIQPGLYDSRGSRVRFQPPGVGTKIAEPPIQITFDWDGISSIVNLKTSRQLSAYSLPPIPIRNLSGEEWEKRTFVAYKDYPQSLIHAVLATEDRRFFHHWGIDFIGIARALFRNATSPGELQGGSTITQQVAKNFFLTPERSINRKLNEALFAIMIEHRKTKKQILELYLNEVYMGQRGMMSIHGMGEAARVLFHKDIQAITVPEAAMLAGMISAPNAYNPSRNTEQAVQRRNIVLKSMLEEKYISSAQFERYRTTPVRSHEIEGNSRLAPYFADVVSSQLQEKYGESLESKHLQIYTTLNLEMQKIGEEALADGLDSIDARRERKTGRKVQGCLLAIEPRTGAIRAFVGGRNYSKSQFNRIYQAVRQAGSVFKPVVYAAALELGISQREPITPATLVSDEPWILKTATDTWQPKNYDNTYHGMVTLRRALALSLNVPTAKLGASIGFQDIASLGNRLGFTIGKSYPSLALGALDVSPWQVATAYTVFANGGTKVSLHTIKSIRGDEKDSFDQRIQGQRVLHPQTVFLITDILKTAASEGTAGSMRSLGFTRPAAGKTGTTNDFRDTWFAGYTPDLLCVVWVGYDDNTSLDMVAAETALPIWTNFMKKATQRIPIQDFAIPDGIVTAIIDPTTGELATRACPYIEREYFIAGTEPNLRCSLHSFDHNSYPYLYDHHPRKRHKKKWWQNLKFWD